MDFSLEEAVSLTSYNASRYLKLNNVGVIDNNYISNFVVLDKKIKPSKYIYMEKNRCLIQLFYLKHYQYQKK